LKSISDLHLLKRVELISLEKLALLEKDGEITEILLSQKKEIKRIKDVKKRDLFLKAFEEGKDRLVLGIDLKDKKVKYNPNPLYLFYSSFLDGIRTLKSLVSGRLSPKLVMGPVGIVQVVQRSWHLGILESLFWLGIISLNLGFVNLLPIPVLDGGHIVFSVVEMITKKPIKAKTMEKLIIPFIVLLILAFIFITYNDILRWVKGFFS
jgi:regulator of sigma E protease